MSEDIALVERLADEFAERFRRGERPAIREYTDRYPEHASIIRDTFEALALMENLAPGSEESLFQAGQQRPTIADGMAFRQLGDFRILREVGRGGMGIVYEAEQVSLGRHVALKILSKEMFGKTKHRLRFEREARTAAKLHHTNIVPVFGVGEDDGSSYYVMQFIQGLALDGVLDELKRIQASSDTSRATSHQGELRVSRREVSAADAARWLMSGTLQPLVAESEDSRIRRREDVTLAHDSGAPSSGTSPSNASRDAGRLSDTFSLADSSLVSTVVPERTVKRQTYWESVAQIGVQVASALGYAHGQGVLHRDIKPANLLLDTRGTVWVTDFGLAKLEDDRNLTQTGDVLGTLRYMAPETLRGNFDVRSEIYSLGLTLYELLALQPAFDQISRNSLVDQVANARFEPLGKRNSEIPRDLVTIVHKALELDPQHRYQTAEELAGDLQRFLDDEPIRARRIPVCERIGRWARRNRGLAAALSAVALLLLVLNIAGPVFTIWLMDAHRSLQQSEGDSRRAWRLAEDRAAENARLAEENANLAAAERAIADQAKAAEQREAELRRIAEQRERRIQETLYAAEVNLAGQAAEEPAGLRRVLELTDRWSSPQPGRDLRNWEWYYLVGLCHQDRMTVQHFGVTCVDWSPNGKHFASGGNDRSVRIWQAASGTLLATLTGHSDQVNALAWNGDGSRIATGGRDKTIRIWNATTAESLATLGGHEFFVSSVAWSPDGTRLASAASHFSGEFIIWDVETRQQRTRIQTIAGDSRIHWSPDSRLLTVAGAIYDANTGSKVSTSDVGNRARWSPDGQWLAVPDGSQVAIRTALGDEARISLTGHSDLVRCVDWSPDGKFLVTGGNDNTVKTWDGSTGQEIATLRGHTDQVNDVKWCPDGKQLATVGNGTIKVWETAVPVEPSTTAFALGSGMMIRCLAWNKDGTALAAGGTAGVKILNASSGVVASDIGPERAANWSQFSPTFEWSSNGHAIAVQRSKAVVLFDDRTLEQTHVLVPVEGTMRSVALSPDGLRVATSSWDETVHGDKAILQIYSVATGEEQLATGLHADLFGSLRWSPDGAQLAVAGWNRCGIIDSTSGQQLGSYLGDGWGWAHSIAWNPAGDRIALACMDRTLRIIDAAEGRELAILPGHSGAVLAVSWSPDGKRLASGGEDQMVRIWEPETGAMLLALEGHQAHVNAVAWSPDGLRLASGGRDGLVRIWDASRGYRWVGSPAMLSFIDRRLEANPDDVSDLRLRIRIHESFGNRDAAQRDRQRLRKIFENRLVEAPGDPAAVRDLADVLLAAHQQQVAWTVLQPTENKSQAGADLTILDDGSVLASGVNTARDLYTVTATTEETRISAVRLEVLPDARLPNQGPGRHPSGNFQLAAFRLFRTDGEQDADRQPVPLSDCWTSYAYRAPDADPAGMISDSLSTCWHVWGRFGESHQAIFSLDQPLSIAPDQSLVIELAHPHCPEPVNLGRFRLSVTKDDCFIRREKLRQAIEQAGLAGIPFLASAYLAVGEPAAAAGVLALPSEPAPAEDGVRQLLLAMAFRDFDPPRSLRSYEQLIQWLRDHPIPESLASLVQIAMIEVGGLSSFEARSLLDRLALDTELKRLSGEIAANPESTANHFHRARLYARLGDWRGSADDHLREVELTPEDRLTWLRAAPALILAGDLDGYRSHCRRLVERFGKTTKPDEADIVCKVCLLLADTVERGALPVRTLEDALEQGQASDDLVPWFTAACALSSYRAGEPQQALRWAQKLDDSPTFQSGALALVVRSMAEYRLGQTDQARRTLAEVTESIPVPLRTLGTDQYDGVLPVPDSVIAHDWLIPEILRREAERLILTPDEPLP
ncbi:MAG: protein kinase [Pirellulaceae bacterium]|nr:protein kinase [Pirellulaceae bacterium]